MNPDRIARPNPFVSPIPGTPEPVEPMGGFVFPTWRVALSDAQTGIAAAYERRQRMFRAAHRAGLSYREIAEATGLSATAVGKIIGRGKASLDDQAGA